MQHKQTFIEPVYSQPVPCFTSNSTDGLRERKRAAHWCSLSKNSASAIGSECIVVGTLDGLATFFTRLKTTFNMLCPLPRAINVFSSFKMWQYGQCSIASKYLCMFEICQNVHLSRKTVYMTGEMGSWLSFSQVALTLCVRQPAQIIYMREYILLHDHQFKDGVLARLAFLQVQ